MREFFELVDQAKLTRCKFSDLTRVFHMICLNFCNSLLYHCALGGNDIPVGNKLCHLCK